MKKVAPRLQSLTVRTRRRMNEKVSSWQIQTPRKSKRTKFFAKSAIRGFVFTLQAAFELMILGIGNNIVRNTVLPCTFNTVISHIVVLADVFLLLHSPSSRVATAQRKLELVNDPRVKSFSPTHVVCATCDDKVELMHDVDYNLTLWQEHKAGCSELE